MYISLSNIKYINNPNPLSVNKTKITNDCVNIHSDLNNIPNAAYSRVNFCGVGKVQKVNRITNHKLQNYSGCITGGAVGDALGYPVEFFSLNQIKRYYGKDGITNLVSGEYGKAEISDDTQMSFFTADGLIKAIGPRFKSNEVPDMGIVHESYLDWLVTQTEEFVPKKSGKGWVQSIASLYEQRSPGDTCLKALKSGKYGTISKPINNSKGNGGVMRVAPAGLLYYNNPKMAFEVGARCAAITHGHPSGYLSAGVFSSLIAFIVKGESLENAIDKSIKLLEKYNNNEEVKSAILKAKELAKSDISPEDAIKKIGGGWVAEEAVAIAVYCALKSPDNFEEAVKMAVNHDGDSDSTGAVTGNIMGLLLGEDSIPERWKNTVELSSELKMLASDLLSAPYSIHKIRGRYPYNKGRVPNWYEAPNKKGNAVKLQYVKFSPKDQARMKTMTSKELIEYKRYLIKNRLYTVD